MYIAIDTTTGSANILNAREAIRYALDRPYLKLTKKGEPTKKGFYVISFFYGESASTPWKWFSTAEQARIYAREILGYEDSTLQGVPVTSENYKEIKASLSDLPVNDARELETLLKEENKAEATSC